MAEITLSTPVFFEGGSDGASKIVGVSNKLNRVARYSFSAPAAGASSISLSFTGMAYYSGTQPKTFSFYIGTDKESHVNAGAGSEVTGTLYVDTSGYTTFTGSADILLLPNTTYYLFIFPDTTVWGCYQWAGSAAATAEGGAGLAYIDDGTGYAAYQAYIDNGSGWDLCIPHIDNGSGWDLLT